MRHAPWVVFSGAFSALALMSVLSAVMGAAFPALLPKFATTLMASILFFVFGLKMIREAGDMDGSEMAEEWKETARELDDLSTTANGTELEDLEEGHGLSPSATTPSRAPSPTPEGPRARARTTTVDDARPTSPAARQRSRPTPPSEPTGLTNQIRNMLGQMFSPTFAQALVLTFLGEWGDRSQIATIALAAAHHVVLVSLGTIAGHCVCTMAAVTMGSWLAARISVRHVTLGGAVLFLIFGFIYLFESYTNYRTGTDPVAAVAAALNEPALTAKTVTMTVTATVTGDPAGM